MQLVCRRRRLRREPTVRTTHVAPFTSRFADDRDRARMRRTPHNAILAKGSFKNFNTIEDFKNADKTALFNHLSDEVRPLVPSPREHPSPRRCRLLNVLFCGRC